jgi:hypothetical protein
MRFRSRALVSQSESILLLRAALLACMFAPLLRTSLRPVCRRHAVLGRPIAHPKALPAVLRPGARAYSNGAGQRQPFDSGPWQRRAAVLAILAGGSWAAYHHFQPFRYTVLAAVRCSRVAGEWLRLAIRAFAEWAGSCGGEGCGRLQMDVLQDVRVARGAHGGTLALPPA